MGLPVLAMFAVWMAYGVWLWKRATSVRASASRIPRERRPLLGALYLFAGAGVLLAGLYAVYSAGGFPKGGIAPWAWPVCAILGLAFVHSQVMAGATLMSMAVTDAAPGPSEQDKEGT